MTGRHQKHVSVVQRQLEWHDACVIDDVAPGTGLAVAVGDEQIAIVRTQGGFLAAVSNFDPFSKAFVMARGHVADRGGILKISSPIYQQSFSLETGECLEDRSVRLAVFPVRLVDGQIQVALTARTHPP